MGIGYKAAWLLKHKLMQVMLEHQQGEKLSGRVEIDDAYLGGEHSGRVGCGSPNKVPMLAAVQTTKDKKPVTTQLRRVSGFCKTALANYARTSLQLDCRVWSDGLACFKAVSEAGCTHRALVTGGGRSSAKKPAFKWVNTLLGNVKNAITGNYHAISKKHAPRYLAEFEYRFNRRYNLPTTIERLAFVAIRTPPMPYRLLTLAEVYV